MSEYAGMLIDELTMIMKDQCFGGKYGMIPEIACARLGQGAPIIGAANL